MWSGLRWCLGNGAWSVDGGVACRMGNESWEWDIGLEMWDRE